MDGSGYCAARPAECIVSENDKHFAFVPHMPNGKPCPAVMLEKDLIRFLRLDELGIKNPANMLRYYREIGALKPTKIGNRNCYTIQAALEFLQELT